MRVFITGASGYIGEAVALAFRRAGHQVVGLVRSASSALRLQTEEIIPCIGDMNDPHTFLGEAEKADILIHCAFESSADGPKKDRQNLEALLLAAKKSGTLKTLLYTSGVWVYGNTHNQVVDENSPLNPIEKVTWRPTHEQLVLEAASSTLHTVVFRPGVVYGGSGGLASLWFKGFMIGDGKNHWSMIHRDDLAQAFLLACERKISKRILNINDGSHDAIAQMTQAITRSTQQPITALSYAQALEKYGPVVQGLILDQKVSNRQAMQELGWTPKHTRFSDEAELYYLAWKANTIYQK